MDVGFIFSEGSLLCAKTEPHSHIKIRKQGRTILK